MQFNAPILANANRRAGRAREVPTSLPKPGVRPAAESERAASGGAAGGVQYFSTAQAEDQRQALAAVARGLPMSESTLCASFLDIPCALAEA